MLIHKFFELFGYKLQGIKKTVQHNDFDSIERFILKDIEKKNKIRIFDVGANIGQSRERFSNIFDNLEIYSFEPSKKLFEILKKKYPDKLDYIFDLALSDKSEKKFFNEYKYHHINSFYELEQNSKFELSRKLSSGEDKNFITRKEVKCVSLDEFSGNNLISYIDILKIDTQGSEPEVLIGAEKFLSEQRISIIEVELIIGVAYKRRLSFYDLEKTISKYGYKLIAISQGGNVISYSSYQVDLLYVNKKIFESIVKLDKQNKDIDGVMRQVNHLYKSTY